VLSVTEVDLREVINMRSRMKRNGEILLGSVADDTPFSRIVPTDDVAAIPLAPGELAFEIGIAWRTHDTVRGRVVAKLVGEISPRPGENLEIVQ